MLGMSHDQLSLDFPHADDQVIRGRESISAGAQRGEEFLRLRRGFETDARRFGLVTPVELVELNLLQARNFLRHYHQLGSPVHTSSFPPSVPLLPRFRPFSLVLTRSIQTAPCTLELGPRSFR